MVTTAKLLKRRDASSVIVAIIIAWIVAQLLPVLVAPLSGVIIGLDERQYISYTIPGASWQAQYLQPVLSAVLQLVLLEVILWMYVMAKSMTGRR